MTLKEGGQFAQKGGFLEKHVSFKCAQIVLKTNYMKYFNIIICTWQMLLTEPPQKSLTFSQNTTSTVEGEILFKPT